jgi:large repetitive protein
MMPLKIARFAWGSCALAAVGAACSTSGGGAGPSSPADAATDAPLLTTETGSCTVAATGTSGLLLQGRLLLPSGPTTGELLINSAGIIVCAQASCASAPGYASATTIACTNTVISPGLVDAHDHSEYATLPPEGHGTIRYDHRNDWRTGAEGFKALPTVPETKSVAVMAAQELRLLLGGVTSVLGSGGAPGLVRNLAEYNDAAELQGLTGPSAYFDTFPLGDEDGQLLTSGCAYPAIEPESYAFEGTSVYAPHIAEGINLAAQNEFLCASDAVIDLVQMHTSIIHGVGMNATDVAKVAKLGASVIWSPRSNIGLYGNTTPVTEYNYAGVNIALGTDWLPSGSMNMLREFACATALNQKYFASTFTDEQIWQMATANAAKASGFGSQIGALTAGMAADVTVFDAGTNQDYQAVLSASVEDVHLVLRGGQPLYGDAGLVGQLATSCTPLDVCNNSRLVCVDVPSTMLSDIQTATMPIYPLFFCRGTVPTDEPSCVPYRDTYPDGTSATDRDGDGIPDTTDDCPSIFNPIRPMDGDKQSDVDGNGLGDACDPKAFGP